MIVVAATARRHAKRWLREHGLSQRQANVFVATRDRDIPIGMSLLPYEVHIAPGGKFSGERWARLSEAINLQIVATPGGHRAWHLSNFDAVTRGAVCRCPRELCGSVDLRFTHPKCKVHRLYGSDDEIVGHSGISCPDIGTWPFFERDV